MVRVTDMTHGRPIRLILLFSLPLMLGSVFQQLYTIVDTIIIGRGVGMQALASIGAADWINWLVLWGLQGFTQGFAILVAQEFGAGAYDRLRRVLAMIVKLSCWFGIAVTIISLLLVRPLLTLLHTDPAVFGGAQTYLYVQFGGSLIIIAYNMAAAVLRCLGDSRTPLFAIIAASFANIALDLLFVMGLGWGIFGASFATVLAQLIAFLLCLRSLRRLPFVQLTKADWKTDPAILLHLCRLGIPTGLQMSMITLGGMVLQSVLNGFSVVFVAGYTAANKLYGILESASVAFGYAMTAYMGQNRGARNAARIDAGIRAVLVLSAEFTAAIVTAMLLAGKPLLGLFLSTEEAGAADALAVAHRYLMLLMAFLFCGLTMNAVGRAAQKMVNEVRRQFREIKGIMEGKAEPDYARCVEISTRGAQKEMLFPSLLAIVIPIVVGLIFGVAGVMGLLAGGLGSGFVLAIFMANSGGAWDNAKKYVEEGNLGGKGSECHKATVIGDTVGDPFKDTSGPSLNILIKLMSMVAIVMAGDHQRVYCPVHVFRRGVLYHAGPAVLCAGRRDHGYRRYFQADRFRGQCHDRKCDRRPWDCHHCGLHVLRCHFRFRYSGSLSHGVHHRPD